MYNSYIIMSSESGAKKKVGVIYLQAVHIFLFASVAFIRESRAGGTIEAAFEWHSSDLL